jgi:membrane protease YdiL (CAAX protease family)
VFRDPEPPRRPRLWEAWSGGQLLTFALLLLGAHLFWQVLVFELTGDAFGPVLVAAAVAVVLPCAAAAWWHGETLWQAFEIRPGRGPALVGAAAGLLAWAPAGLLAELSSRLRPPSAEYLEFLQQHLPEGPGAVALAFVAVTVGAPVAEELLFRGLLFRLARGRWGVLRGAVLTALFFGVAHWEPWSLFGLVGLGLLLAMLYHWTGSLLAPMVAHGVHNAISLAVMLRWRDQLITQTPAASTGEDLVLVALSGALLAVLLWWLNRRRRGGAP